MADAEIGRGPDMMPKRILVVGGQSRAARAFRQRMEFNADLALTTLVRRPCPTIGREKLITVADYFDPPSALLGEADVVINFVGVTHGRDTRLFDEVNVKGPLRLARCAMKCGLPHFVHLSSFHVYGYANQISQATPEAPVTPYGRSKLHADAALLDMQSDGFTVSVLRLPMLYGGGAGDNLRRLATLIARTNVIPVRSSPAPRSVLHVDNLAAVLATLSRGDTPGVCFAADADQFTIELLAEAISMATGRRPRLVYLPDMTFLPLRIVSRGLYNKLYESKFVLQSDCIVPQGLLPVALRNGLKDMLSCEGGVA